MNQKTRREDLTKIEQKEKSLSTTNLLITFKDYDVIKELNAQGGEADSYVIEKDGVQYFLKLYRKGFNPDIEVLKNLKEISKKIKQHVVEIFEVGFDEKLQRYYEILEYIENGDLATLKKEINESKNKEKIIDIIIKEISLALKSLHDINIIHRDLKPKNILIRKKHPLDLVLIDFGISKALDEELSKVDTTSFKGTTSYVAPEEISNYFGKEIDWWHLGVIVLELLTGKHPFQNLSEQAIIHILTTKGIEIPDNIPEKYKTLLRGLLTRNYENRWGFNQIERWLKGEKNIPIYYEQNILIKADDKEWEKYGFPENSPWRNLNFEPKKVITFKEADFGVSEARTWMNVGWTNGKSARRWYDNGFEAEEAYIFENLGFSLSQAKTLKAKNIFAYDLNLIKNHIEDIEEFVSDLFEFLNKYDLKGILKDYPKWKKEGISFKEAIEWYYQGFNPKDVRIFIDNGININQATKLKEQYNRWLQEGFTLNDAINMQKAGFGLEDAIKIKNSNMTINEIKIWLNEDFKLDDAINYHKNHISIELAKRWIKLGLNTKVILKWIQQNIPLEEAKKWINVGFKIPSEVKRWIEANISPKEAYEWNSLGVDVSEAKSWKSANINIKEAAKWIKAGISFEERSNWINHGFSFQEIKKAKELGLKIHECIKGKELGFSIQEIKSYKDAKIDLNEAKKWKDAKIPFEYAIQYIKINIPLEEAKKWFGEKISIEETIQWTKENFSFEEAVKWIKNGLFFSDAIPWIKNRIFFDEAKKLIDSGFTADDIPTYLKSKIDLKEILNWKKAGFNIKEIFSWKKLKVKLEDAKIYRNENLTSNIYKNFILLGLLIYTTTFLIFSFEFAKMHLALTVQFFMITFWWVFWTFWAVLLFSNLKFSLMFNLIRKTFKNFNIRLAKALFFIYFIFFIIFIYRAYNNIGNFSRTLISFTFHLIFASLFNIVIYLITKLIHKTNQKNSEQTK